MYTGVGQIIMYNGWQGFSLSEKEVTNKQEKNPE